MYVGFRVKCPLLLPEFNETCIYLEILKKKKVLQNQISWKSFQREPSYCIWTDGQTVPNNRFTKFCERT